MTLAVVGEVIAGRYELEELLGTGGMSSVYRARDHLLERTVALKLLHDRYSDDADYVERFRREARAAARLSHPNIVTVIDRGEQDGRQFIVFEHVGGETLKQLIDRSGPLPIGEALELAIQVGRALSFAHEHGLVHRDVKPQNVLLNGDGRAKVTDFGIARTVDVEEATTTGVVVGTSHYISPEQARGERVDAQSDVYSLGAVLYELLAGEVPFPGENFVTVAMRHVREPLPSLLDKRPELPLRLVAVVERALQKDPSRRFGSMSDFVAELQACLADLGAEREQEPTLIVRKVALPERARPRERRRRPLWPLVLILAGLGIGAIAVGLYLARVAPLGGNGHASSGQVVQLRAVATYDPPPGDGQEHDDMVQYATDHSPSTYWETESYENLHALKPGVGLVLDAGKSVSPSVVKVSSRGSEFTARIETGDSAAGPFHIASQTLPVDGVRRFKLVRAVPARYLVVWITNVSGRALINEVRATS